jgi:hypothetical protein
MPFHDYLRQILVIFSRFYVLILSSILLGGGEMRENLSNKHQASEAQSVTG